MASLTEQLDALLVEHDLASITITRLARGDGTGFWSVNAQCEKANGSREIGSADYGTADVNVAVAEAIVDLNGKRRPAVSVVELASLEQAA